VVPGWLRRTVSAAACALLVVAPSAAAGRSSHAVNVQIKASGPPWMIAGNHVRITGTVTPHPSGLEVNLQQRHGTGWITVGNTKGVDTAGAFSFITTASKLGDNSFRVVTTKGTNFVGASAGVPIRVLHWMDFMSVPQFANAVPDPGDGDFNNGPMVSDGVHYTDSVTLDPGCYNQWAGNAWIDYLLYKKYEAFTATVGIADGVPEGSTATYSMIGAGKKLASGSLTLGMKQKINVSLDGVYRLRFEINVPDPNDSAGCASTFPQVVFGNPRVLGP